MHASGRKHVFQSIKFFPSMPLYLLQVYSSFHARPSTSARLLVGGSLASLELLEVPVADLHVSAVLVHALGEVLRGSLAVVAVAVLVVLGGSSGLRRGGNGLGGTAGEEATDGVAYRRANGDTTASRNY